MVGDLYYGDCLRVLRQHIPLESIDLIYLDPPFNSKRDYNLAHDGKSQAQVFKDTWVWSQTQDEALEYVASDPELYQQVIMLLQFAGSGPIAGSGGLRAYLAYMSARLLACHRALKDTGSIYLHCDPTAGHYLKLLMDAVFGSKNFRNEIVWCYTGPANTPRWFPRKHDTIYFYAKSDLAAFHRDRTRIPYKSESFTMGGSGSLARRNKPGTDYTTGAEEQLAKGKVVEDYWIDIPSLSVSSEYLGYQTQKLLALLKRIICATSNPGDIVLDPFCGCGTAVISACRFGRRWIGIDVEPLAIDLVGRRLRTDCGVDPRIHGVPYNFDQARRLASNAPYEFERWALRLIPGAQPNFKQSGDGGIDGRAVVDVEEDPKPLFGFQVKGGQRIGRPMLDAFRGALTQNDCAAGLFIVLEEATAARLRGQLAGQERVTLDGWTDGRIQVWSIEDWFRRGEHCDISLPTLVGSDEPVLNLLREQTWQIGMDLPGYEPLEECDEYVDGELDDTEFDVD